MCLAVAVTGDRLQIKRTDRWKVLSQSISYRRSVLVLSGRVIAHSNDGELRSQSDLPPSSSSPQLRTGRCLFATVGDVLHLLAALAGNLKRSLHRMQLSSSIVSYTEERQYLNINWILREDIIDRHHLNYNIHLVLLWISFALWNVQCLYRLSLL